MIVLDVENIKLVSKNKKTGGYDPRTKRIYQTSEYKEFKNTIVLLLLKYGRGVKIEPPYSVKIYVSTYLDIGNFLEPIFDGLEKSGIINNDRNILHQETIKIPLKRGSLSSIKVEVSQWSK